MRAYDIIYKKREGLELSEEEINYLIKGYTSGDIPDYQLSAWAMAVFFQGMNKKETAYLTTAMTESGDMLNLNKIKGIKVDKHSTGGVGDTTTLVLAPLVAAAGVPVAKLSGRGLGHTGGTIDKLESIPGFSTDLSMDEFINNVNKIAIAVAGQTADLTPADKKLYALRDVTATVESISLIASSIMSKKIAGGADRIVLDVKTGSGAFMKNLDEARKLALAMVDIGKETGRKTTAVISSMEQPLGFAVGNSLEVREAVDTLRGDGPEDLRDLCLELGANMLYLAEKAEDIKEGKNILNKLLNSGAAYEKFLEFVEKQGGDSIVLKNNTLPKAEYIVEVKSTAQGCVTKIDALEVGLTAVQLGAGREKKGDEIDYTAGVLLKKKCGDRVSEGDVLAKLHTGDRNLLAEAEKRLLKSFTIKEGKASKNPLIYDVVK